MEVYLVLSYSAYSIALMISFIIAILLVARLWTMRSRPGTTSLISSIAALSLWTLAYSVEILAEDTASKIFCARLEYLGIAALPPAIFLFAMIYSGRGKWMNLHRILILSIIPVITAGLVFTNETHHLIWKSIERTEISPIGPLSVSYGHWFWVHTAYSYSLILLATIVFIQMVIRRQGLYRAQAGVMLAGMGVPWAANIFYLIGLDPIPGLDWTPLAFLFTVFGLEVGFTRYRLADIIPVAQNSIFNTMLDGVLVVDLQQRIIEANPSAEDIFLRSSDSLIGLPVGDVIPEWNELIQRTRPGVQDSYEFVPDDKPLSVYDLRIETIVDKSKLQTGYLVFLNDVTEKKKSRDQILLQSAALEAAANGIVITNANGIIEWVNPAFSRLTGYSREEVLGQHTRIMKSGQHSDGFYQDLWDTIGNGKVWHGELINRRKDGSLYHEEMTITPLVQPEGTLSSYIAVKQDISDRKQAEEELRLAHGQALEANRLKTQLLANVSHDLRTPLGGVIGYADMIASGVFGEINEEQNRAISEITDSANQLLVFINNLIGQAQIETGKIVLRPIPFEPSELVIVLKSTMSLYARRKKLALEFEIAPGFPAQITADMYWLKQVLLNLIGNALKFTNEGHVSVRFFMPDDHHWSVSVEDTGRGISADDQKIIFEVFRQTGQTGAHESGGSGLGLSIVKELTSLMQGSLQVESQVGQGSTFTVTFPFIEVKQDE
ncbi:MAG: PAS domain S-box protein [Anaerolineales bacterium]|nr:PAS domain S-box protein [Anaerolineales bacterium]